MGDSGRNSGKRRNALNGNETVMGPEGFEPPNQGIMSPFLAVLHRVAQQRKNVSISFISI